MICYRRIANSLMTFLFASAAFAANPDADDNLSLMCQVRTSSCFDYNLTGQLLTDGIVTTAMPPTLTVCDAAGPLPRREREWAIDGGEWTRNTLMGSSNSLQYQWTAMSVKADRIKLRCYVAYDEAKAHGGYSIKVLVPTGKKGGWRVVAEDRGGKLPGTLSKSKVSSDPNKQTGTSMLPQRDINLQFDLPADCRDITAMRLELDMEGAVYWTVFNIDFYKDGGRVLADVIPNSRFGSAWMSAGEGHEWAQVDLAAKSEVSFVDLSWIRRPKHGYIEVSDDARQWRRVATLPDNSKRRTDRIKLSGVSCRYVRVTMDGGSIDVAKTGDVPTKAYVLSELKVEGKGVRCDTESATRPGMESANGGYADNRMMLNAGDWKVCRASQVKAGGEKVSTRQFATDDSWIPATVPATVLTSFVNYGALANPDYADNMFGISDSYFNSDFWYRRTFSLPKEMAGQRVLLNFDGINWKADVWVNGMKIDRIEGAFTRSVADITPYLNGGVNTLAVLIHKNAHPGAIKEKNHLNTDFNGGILGADNPTFHATIGWDWISTIRGRDIGIWNDVYLTSTASVTLADPVVSTRFDNLPDTLATMTPRVLAHNWLDKEVSGTLRGWIGNLKFEKNITLKAGEQREVVFSPDEYQTLCDRRIRLWWPNGHGEPYLHDAGFEFLADNQQSHNATARIHYKAGIREMRYADPDTQLKLFVNGRRIVPLGGNWGFPESNLNYRQREYDIAVRLHRDMNFNMIRNWVGMTGDEEFYDACDKYGIMVWQDFWLANPADGPDPDDEVMFMRNARDFTSRMRRHPSIALYCGRNEGYPPKTLDDGLRQTVAEMNPKLLYISSSADDGVSGHGPYWAEPPRTYFAKQSGKLHTERGMPNVMTPEGTRRTLAEPIEWEPGDAWGQHDFTQAGAQRGASFMAIVERMFGKPESADDFTRLAQWENYEGYRAMYEADSKYRQGLLIWMSHACWPSYTWQCYDYYFEPTAAFFGARKACEPLHIQRNALTRSIEVVNRTADNYKDLVATRELLDIRGNIVRVDSNMVNSNGDSTVELAALATDSVPGKLDGTVYYIRLRLADSNNATLSTNFYVLSTDEGNLQQLATLPQVNVAASVKRPSGNGMTLTLRNTASTPAMMIRLNLKTGDGCQVLPVDYSDNYFHLMPGEERTVNIRWDNADARQQVPFVELTGYNVEQCVLK